MGQPTIPQHRLIIGWICLSIGLIFILYCMIRLWEDFKASYLNEPQTSIVNKHDSHLVMIYAYILVVCDVPNMSNLSRNTVDIHNIAALNELYVNLEKVKRYK